MHLEARLAHGMLELLLGSENATLDEDMALFSERSWF